MFGSKDLKIRIIAQEQAGPALAKVRSGVKSVSEELSLAKQQFLGFWAAAEIKQGVMSLGRMADQIQGVNSRLLIAVGSQDAFNAAQTKAYSISAQTGAGYDATATLLSRLSQVGEGYGLTQERIAATTQVTARSLQLSGAASQESAAVIRQLSQALGSGVLRGEEFNSVMENGPRLAKALADGLGLPIGKLRGLAEQGLLTTDVVVTALESQRGVLEAESENYQRTMGQSASHVTDEFGRMVDAANQWTGAGRGVAASFDYIAEHMREVLGGVAVAAVAALTVSMARGGQAAAIWAVQTVAAQNAAAASSISLHRATVVEAEATVAAALAHRAAAKDYWAQVAADVALQHAKANLTTSTAALATAQGTASVAARGLSAVVGALGGPIGIITMLLTAGATAWMIWGNKAENAANKAKTAAEDAEEAIRRMRSAQAFGEDALAPFRQDVAAAEAMRNEVVKSKSNQFKVSRLWETDDAEIRKAEAKVTQAYTRLNEAARLNRKKLESGAAGGVASSLNIMGASFDEWLGKFRDKIDPVGAALRDLAEKAKDAGIAADSAQYKAAEALIRKSFEKKGSSAGKSLDLDDYGKSALAAIQAQSQRELDILKAKLAGEMSIAQRGFDANTTSLEAYYSERRRIIKTESDAEIAAQEKAITTAQAEQARLRQLSPGGARGREQISDQIRALDEKIADAQARVEVMKTQTSTAVADLAAEQAKAARARVDKGMNDAQAIITAKEQSLESRVVTGLETEATARTKLKAVIGEQARALESELIPEIERLMLVASNPLARAELQAMLDKIREMQATAKTQTWVDGLKQGVTDYAATAKDSFQTARDAATAAFQGAEDAVVQFAKTGKVEFADLVTSINSEIARLAFRDMASQMYEYMSALMSTASGSSSSGSSSWLGTALNLGISAVGSYFGGGSSAAAGSASGGFNYAGEMSSFFSRNAKGNVFDSPGLSDYSNQIVTKPTMFWAKGGNLMGEAGPEAIMPLKRGPDGVLGIQAGGGNSESIALLREIASGIKAQRGTKVVNAIGKGAIANELSGPEGEQVIFNHIRRNSGAVRRMLGIN